MLCFTGWNSVKWKWLKNKDLCLRRTRRVHLKKLCILIAYDTCRTFRRTSIAVKCPKTSPNEHRRFNSWIRNIKFHGHGFYCPGVVPRWGLQFQSIIFSPFCSTSYHPRFPILFAKNCTLPHKNHFLILFFKNICYFCNKGQFLKTWTWEKK